MGNGEWECLASVSCSQQSLLIWCQHVIWTSLKKGTKEPVGKLSRKGMFVCVAGVTVMVLPPFSFFKCTYGSAGTFHLMLTCTEKNATWIWRGKVLHWKFWESKGISNSSHLLNFQGLYYLFKKYNQIVIFLLIKFGNLMCCLLTYLLFIFGPKTHEVSYESTVNGFWSHFI